MYGFFIVQLIFFLELYVAKAEERGENQSEQIGIWRISSTQAKKRKTEGEEKNRFFEEVCKHKAIWGKNEKSWKLKKAESSEEDNGFGHFLTGLQVQVLNTSLSTLSI
jgi:hypothetical protein